MNPTAKELILVAESTDEISELVRQAVEANQDYEFHREKADTSCHRRDLAIAELARHRMSHADIGRTLGLSRARVSQILKEGPPAERAWWGGSSLITVAVGRKLEEPKPTGQPGPVIAVEDVWARDVLRDHFAGFGLSCQAEEIAAGTVNLNRDGLVVICGPRLSPLIAQIQGSDRFLRFRGENGSWHISELPAGRSWRSPMDTGQSSDIGYLGRLPRPDGQGTFVYIAGIHAAGASGAVHWLTQGGGLYTVWKSARHQRFSCLVKCDFDPGSRNITRSELITPIYKEG